MKKQVTTASHSPAYASKHEKKKIAKFHGNQPIFKTIKHMIVYNK